MVVETDRSFGVATNFNVKFMQHRVSVACEERRKMTIEDGIREEGKTDRNVHLVENYENNNFTPVTTTQLACQGMWKRGGTYITPIIWFNLQIQFQCYKMLNSTFLSLNVNVKQN